MPCGGVWITRLPGSLQLGRSGKYFFGREENKSLMEKVSARLSRWHWLLPQLSYRGRVLVCNNLVASSLWHKMAVLELPEELVASIQKLLVTFFFLVWAALAKSTCAISTQTRRRPRIGEY